MALNTTTTSGLTNLARTYYAPKLLKALRANLVYANLVSKEGEGVISEQFGPTIQWTRMKALNEGRTLSEGGSATTQALSTETVTAKLVQKGAAVSISDCLYAYTLLRKIEAVVEKMGQSAAETVDSMIRRKLCQGGFRETSVGVDLDASTILSNVSHSAITGGTTKAVTYSNGGAAYYHLPYLCLSGTGTKPTDIMKVINSATPETVPANFTTAAMCMTVKKLIYAATYLKAQNVPAFSDGYYRAVVDSWQAFDLANDPQLVSWVNYGSSDAKSGNGKIEYMNGEIGAIGKIRIFESTQATKAMHTHGVSGYFSASNASAAWTPTVCTIVGDGCCAIVDHAATEVGSTGEQALANIKLDMLGFVPDKTDIHGSYMVIGYKIATAVGILDTARGVNLLQFYATRGHA